MNAGHANPAVGSQGSPSGGAAATSAKGGSSHNLGMIALIAMAVGTMVGGGVFALSGMVVQEAGAGSIIAYILAGIVMMLSALCFAAVSSRAKPGETGYAPLGRTLGPVWRFITMWAFYIMGVSATAYVLMSFGSYFRVFVPHAAAVVVSLVAVAALMFLNWGPTALVGKAETVMVGFKVGVLILVIIFGFIAFKPSFFDNWAPHGFGSVLSATALLFTAYAGFNVITNVSGSVKNSEKKVPRAIILSLAIVAAIYIGVAIALVVSGQAGDHGFAQNGLTLAAKKIMGAWGVTLVGIAALVSTLSGANANLLGSGDLLVRMAATGDIPSKFGRLSKKGNPILAITVSTAIIVVLMLAAHFTGSGGMRLIVVFTNVSGIIALILVDITAAKMAFGHWKTPGVKLKGGMLIPILAIIAAAIQIPSLGKWWETAIGTAMVAVGFLIWAFRKHSDPQEVHEINHHLAHNNTPLHRVARGVDYVLSGGKRHANVPSVPPVPPMPVAAGAAGSGGVASEASGSAGA